MLALLKKMNYKGQSPLVVLNAPAGFVENLAAALPDAKVETELGEVQQAEFFLAFVTQQSQIDTFAPAMAAKLAGDGLLWFAYPKATSRRYKCDFNRDTGWDILGRLGFEPVRMVAIDEDWSGFRLRRVEFIKKMTRSFAMSEEGKKKVDKGG